MIAAATVKASTSAQTTVLEVAHLVREHRRAVAHVVDRDVATGPAVAVGLTHAAQAEHVLDKMEHLIQQAKDIREAAKNGSMTDDERRERAGDAALALVNLMGQLGMDDGEESDESDNSSVE